MSADAPPRPLAVLRRAAALALLALVSTAVVGCGDTRVSVTYVTTPPPAPAATLPQAAVRATQPPASPDATAPYAGSRLKAHELFGFAPYWTLYAERGFQYADLTTIAYFGVDVAPDGSLVRSGAGWDGYTSPALVDLVDRAHAAGDSVVLTAKCFDQPTLDALLHDQSAATRLAGELVTAVRDKHMDGVNIDLEGAGGSERAALTSLVGLVAQRVHAADPHWQVTVDTYPYSASDSAGWFDAAALAREVDALFVMAYGMQDNAHASPVSPLQGAGRTDFNVLSEYLQVVPTDRLILGVPFYGLDWQVSGPELGAAATSPPTVLNEAAIVAAGHPRYWDLEAFTPWTEYQDSSGVWHETHWDDADSLGYKARLAASGNLRGLGIWALGMDGNDRSMTQALLGNSKPHREVVGPPATPKPQSGG